MPHRVAVHYRRGLDSADRSDLALRPSRPQDTPLPAPHGVARLRGGIWISLYGVIKSAAQAWAGSGSRSRGKALSSNHSPPKRAVQNTRSPATVLPKKGIAAT